MNFLSRIGKDFKSVFNWLGSAKGQAVITAGEGVVTAVDPSLAGIFNLANSWITKVVTTETLAVAAGQQAGSSAQKAAAVITAMAPQITQYFPTATSVEINNANTAIVAFLNAFNTTATSGGVVVNPPNVPQPTASVAK